jgi:hypothetical protein
MPLQIIAHRGVRLNDGISKIRYAGNQYASNTTLSYPRTFSDKSQIDFSAHAYENTLRAISIAWQLGYKVTADVYTYGVIHHDRFIKRDQAQLIDHMSQEDIAQVNLSVSGLPQDDGNRIPLLGELLGEQVRLKQEGLIPSPRLQLQLKKPADVQKIIGEVIAHIVSGQLAVSDITITSFHYDLLALASGAMDGIVGDKPQIGYLIACEALDYVSLDRSAADYSEQLKAQAARAIPLFLRERMVLVDELKEHFPELAGLSTEQMEETVPSLVERYGVRVFEQQYESCLELLVGSGLNAGYRLNQDALAGAVFDAVHIPMDAAPGVAEAYKARLDAISYRGGRLRVNAHSVSRGGRNPSQLLRAFILLDDNSEFTLDYPEMVPGFFAGLVGAGASKRDSDKMQLSFDPTRKTRIDGVEFTTAQVEKATKRFFDILGIPYQTVTDSAQSRIGGNRHASRIEIDPQAARPPASD